MGNRYTVPGNPLEILPGNPVPGNVDSLTVLL
jgi:hypothetical protein